MDDNTLNPAVRELLHCHKKGTDYIKQALDLDEHSG